MVNITCLSTFDARCQYFIRFLNNCSHSSNTVLQKGNDLILDRIGMNNIGVGSETTKKIMGEMLKSMLIINTGRSTLRPPSRYPFEEIVMYHSVINFWFTEIKPSQWWVKDDAFDQLITRRFSDVHDKAAKCELYEWRETPRGRLAEIIVLDQFSRNMFRDTPQAFAQDQMALILAQEAISGGVDKQLEPKERGFMYLPLMHSESIVIHEAAEALYREHGDPSNLKFELKHKQIIERFGRYPHRNKILGRVSTDEEITFLQQPGSSF